MFKFMYGLVGYSYQVAALSTLYLTVSGISIPIIDRTIGYFV